MLLVGALIPVAEAMPGLLDCLAGMRGPSMAVLTVSVSVVTTTVSASILTETGSGMAVVHLIVTLIPVC